MVAKAPAREFSIKGKITMMVMLTSGTALLMACFGFALHDVYTFREEKVRELDSFAEIIAAGSARSLTGMDAGAAGEIVGSLPGNRNILAACLYSVEGGLLTGFVSHAGTGDACPERSPVHGHRFQGDRLQLSHPAMLAGETVGTVLLISGLDGMWLRPVRYSEIAGIVLLISMLVALGASARLRAVISRPILVLADAARKVSGERDYRIRVERLVGGELGALTDAFNEMLSRIQARDDELLRAQGELEQKLAEMKSQASVAEPPPGDAGGEEPEDPLEVPEEEAEGELVLSLETLEGS